MQLNPTVSEADLLIMQAMAQLQSQTPKNEFGFPIGIYRPDLLPLHDWHPDETVDELVAHLTLGL